MSVGRIFQAGSEVVVLEISDALGEAWDILVAGGIHPDKAAQIAVGAQNGGYDPVVMARKFLRLHRAAREGMTR